MKIYNIISKIISMALEHHIIEQHGYCTDERHYDENDKVVKQSIKLKFANNDNDTFDGEFATLKIHDWTFDICCSDINKSDDASVTIEITNADNSHLIVCEMYNSKALLDKLEVIIEAMTQ